MEQVFCLFVFTICVRVSLSALGLNCLIRQRASHIPEHLPTAPSMALQGLPVTSFPRFSFSIYNLSLAGKVLAGTAVQVAALTS